MTGLAGQVVVVTGAASGIGAAIARRFAADGATLLMSDIQVEAGEALASELTADFVCADVTREDDVEALVQAAVRKHGRLDCMINNAGVVGVTGSVRDIAAADFDTTMAILLRSVFFGMKHAARVMVPRKAGAILSTTSVAGVAALGPLVYSAAKHGIVGLTRSVATELAPHGIRVNAVAPGTVPTPLTSDVFGGLDGVRAIAEQRTPLGRAVEAEDIAEGFAYLAGIGGRAITGQVLVIDGGTTGCPGGTRFDQPGGAAST